MLTDIELVSMKALILKSQSYCLHGISTYKCTENLKMFIHNIQYVSMHTYLNKDLSPLFCGPGNLVLRFPFSCIQDPYIFTAEKSAVIVYA